MVDVLDSMIEGVADALRLGDREAVARARRPDDLLDALNSEIKRYLTRLDPESLTDDEHRRAEAVLAISLNLEGAGDVVERNLASFVAKRLKRGASRAGATIGRSGRLSRPFASNLRSAASVFMTGDRRAARVLSQQKAEFRRREAKAIKAHFARLRGRASGHAAGAAPRSSARHQAPERPPGGRRRLSGARSRRGIDAERDSSRTVGTGHPA